MGEDRDWQKQLMSAALMAAAKHAVHYVTNPDSREQTVSDVRSRLAEVDYGAAARAVSDIIDRLAESSKIALNEAIDSIRENAEGAVEAAAEKAQEQLGTAQQPRRRRGRMLFGMVFGIALGFILLNEDRRNQVLDRLTGATGPIDSSQWNTVASNSQPSASADVAAPPPAAEEASEEPAATVSAAETADETPGANGATADATPKPAKTESKKSKAAQE